MKVDRNTIWIIVLLIGGYITLQLVADVSTAKIMQVWGLTLPAGCLVYAITFTWRDLIHKRLGREWARAAIVVAAFMNVFMVLSFLAVIRFDYPVWWGNQAAIESVLGIVWRITVASIIAELISELVDTEVYHQLIERIPSRHQWARVLGSNLVSLPLDSVIFATIAFAGTMPLSGLTELMWGQIVFKALVTVVSLPAIYAIPERPILRPQFAAGD
jgi:uncharacterized integral membrane protein (TIGR00697 family)